jgi:ABC-2 type transport system ATP-binding protein
MEEAEYCDRLVIMARGKVLAEGTPEKLKDSCPGEAGREPTMEDAFIYLLEQQEAAG